MKHKVDPDIRFKHEFDFRERDKDKFPRIVAFHRTNYGGYYYRCPDEIFEQLEEVFGTPRFWGRGNGNYTCMNQAHGVGITAPMTLPMTL